MGYFRIFYYVAYIFNTITRIIKRHGKWLLWFVCIAIFLVVCMYNPRSQAAYIGNDDYFDGNYALYQDYDSTLIDMLKRLENLSSQYDTIKTRFLDMIKSNNIGYFCYYASSNNNYENINGTNLNVANIRVMLYYRNVNYITRSPSNYDNYRGVDCSIHEITFGNYVLFNFGLSNLVEISSSSSLSDNPQMIYIPDILYGYNSSIYNYYFVNNFSIEEIEVLHDMDEKLASVDETLQQQQEFLEQEPSSEDFSTSDLPTDSGVTDTTTTGVDNIFTTVYNVFTGDVEVSKRNLNITIPFTRKEISNSLYFNK